MDYNWNIGHILYRQMAVFALKSHKIYNYMQNNIL